MKQTDKRNLSEVFVAKGKKLIICRSIEEELTDPYCRTEKRPQELKYELRHFGRCQRVTIIDYTGDDYTQAGQSGPESTTSPSAHPQAPHVYTDMNHAPMIKTVDLSRFDRRPGCIIRIEPRKPVRFLKVTVRVCDLFGRELVHGQAWNVHDTQEWTFSYFPQHKLNPTPGNLRITICASEKPRECHEEQGDPYEMPPDKLRELAFSQN